VDILDEGGSGLRLLEAVRTNPRLHWLPAIVTGDTFSPKLVQRCLELGANEIVVTPVVEESFVAKLCRTLTEGTYRVLVIDDDEPVLEVLKDTLEIERLQVVTALSAEEGLNTLRQGCKVDVVVSDVLLPGMSGIDLLKQIKQEFADLPVILITGYSGQFGPKEAMAAGADGYFAKPFKNIELMYTLRRVLDDSPRHSDTARIATVQREG
jgi:CheY-like chemotaxis protein